MEKDYIYDLFDELKNEFDNAALTDGHEERFLSKLKSNTVVDVTKSNRVKQWPKIIAIAASVILCFSIITFGFNTEEDTLDLASISPELSETQDFFTATINNELKKLNKERSPFTEEVVTDALEQIKILEDEYNILRTELTNQSKNERIIYAMIANFQGRIDILNSVLEHIETIKEFKNTSNDTKNTI